MGWAAGRFWAGAKVDARRMAQAERDEKVLVAKETGMAMFYRVRVRGARVSVAL